jgi:hypothetical protein
VQFSSQHAKKWIIFCGRNGEPLRPFLNLCALEEEAMELTFKIGGENLLADGGADFFECPKASTIKFVF